MRRVILKEQDRAQAIHIFVLELAYSFNSHSEKPHE